MNRPRAVQRAYTLIELISVMVIIGVLAVVALARFADVDVFASRGFFEEALAATRYAHKLAIASGCSIQVSFSAAGDNLAISRWSGGSDCSVVSGPPSLVARPGGGGGYSATAPSGVDVSNDLLFYFDRIGRPHSLGGALITSATSLRVDIDSRRLQVIPETGLVLEN